MEPRGKKEMLRDLAIRNYGDKDAQRSMIRDYYGPEERSPNFYDPAKLTLNQKLKIQKQQAEVLGRNKIKEPAPTQEEIKAERVMDFSHVVNFDQPPQKRWTCKR